MAYLLDTGVLLRLVNVQDQSHAVVRQAIERLTADKEELFITTQNVAELWNVGTRPVADNGLGLSIAIVAKLLEGLIEPICAILFERHTLHSEFKRLSLQYGVSGKQVHDARLAAQMLTWNIERILTLNDRDFRRYEPEGIEVVHPNSLIGN
jgi:predicted nucleic acid-binding protein